MPRFLRIVAIAALLACAARAKTYEGFNLSFKAAGGVNNPYIYFGERLGNAFVFVTPSLDFFENRFSMELDLGISNQVFRSEFHESVRTMYQPSRDTLYRSRYWYEDREDITQLLYAYKGVLNFDRWRLFAGSMVYVRVHEGTEKVEEYRSYATGGELDSFTSIETDEREYDYLWSWGTVFPVYGVVRRFGRWSLFLQGVSIVSLHAGASWSVFPPRGIAPHK
jgi:hypothetical protein